LPWAIEEYFLSSGPLGQQVLKIITDHVGYKLMVWIGFFTAIVDKTGPMAEL
jgi:hypothetical protein